jgi:hypothetical protein
MAGVSGEASTSFRYSMPKLIGLLVIGVGLTGLCLAIALGVMPISSPSNALHWVMGFGAVFFAVCVVGWSTRLFRTGPIVEVSASGIRDLRLSADVIPWSDIERLSVLTVSRQSMLTLELRPGVQSNLRAAHAAWIRTRLNEIFGFPGLVISMTGLDGSLDDLLDAIESVQAGRSRQR